MRRWFMVVLIVGSSTAANLPSMKREQQLTECGKPWQFRSGADRDLTMVANYAAHIASQRFKFERRDVLVRLIGGFIKDCPSPKYRIEAEFTSSNCTMADAPSYEPDDCVALPGAPIKYCKINVFIPPHREAQLVNYDCKEEQMGPNWKPHEITCGELLQAGYRAPQYITDDHLDAVSSGVSPFFLLFCAFLPVAGLVILYKIW